MSTTDLEAVLDRLDRLESVLAIEHLHHRYAECVDRARFPELGELFAHGAISADVSDDAMSGADEISEFYARTNRVHADGTLRTRHLATNVIVDVADDRRHARSQSYFVVFQATDDLPLQPIVAGRYNDTFVRIDGTWCFEHRRVFVDQIGDMREHLTIDLQRERVNVADVLGGRD